MRKRPAFQVREHIFLVNNKHPLITLFMLHVLEKKGVSLCWLKINQALWNLNHAFILSAPAYMVANNTSMHCIPRGFDTQFCWANIPQVTTLIQYCEDTNTKISGKAYISPQTPSLYIWNGSTIWSQ